jgi:hypothetical protein
MKFTVDAEVILRECDDTASSQVIEMLMKLLMEAKLGKLNS